MIRHGVRSGLSAGQAAASLRAIFSYYFLTTVHVPMLQNPGIAPFSGRMKIDRPVWSQIFFAPGGCRPGLCSGEFVHIMFLCRMSSPNPVESAGAPTPDRGCPRAGPDGRAIGSGFGGSLPPCGCAAQLSGRMAPLHVHAVDPERKPDPMRRTPGRFLKGGVEVVPGLGREAGIRVRRASSRRADGRCGPATTGRRGLCPTSACNPEHGAPRPPSGSRLHGRAPGPAGEPGDLRRRASSRIPRCRNSSGPGCRSPAGRTTGRPSRRR